MRRAPPRRRRDAGDPLGLDQRRAAAVTHDPEPAPHLGDAKLQDPRCTAPLEIHEENRLLGPVHLALPNTGPPRNPNPEWPNFRVFRGVRGLNQGVDLSPYRAFITELADQSGAFIRPYFGRLEFCNDCELCLRSDRWLDRWLY